MRFSYIDNKYKASIRVNEVDSKVILDTGSPITVLRNKVIIDSLREGYDAFARAVRKFKPISFIGFGGEIVNLYPATFNKVELSGLTLEPFACYVDLDRCSGNSLIGTDLISVCMINRSMGNYAIDLVLNDYTEYTRKFVDNYIASTHADINILEELNKLSKSIDNC